MSVGETTLCWAQCDCRDCQGSRKPTVIGDISIADFVDGLRAGGWSQPDRNHAAVWHCPACTERRRTQKAEA